MISKEKQKELERRETEDSKLCIGCNKVKPLFEFAIHPNGRKNSGAYCCKCQKEKNMLRNYGITLEQYDKMLEEQDGKCKICKTETPGGRGRFNIDHDHVTGKIRGLLCFHCNMVLGQVKDDIKILTSMTQYLIESRK